MVREADAPDNSGEEGAGFEECRGNKGPPPPPPSTRGREEEGGQRGGHTAGRQVTTNGYRELWLSSAGWEFINANIY